MTAKNNRRAVLAADMTAKAAILARLDKVERRLKELREEEANRDDDREILALSAQFSELQAKKSAIEERVNPLFDAVSSECADLAIADLLERGTDLVESMIKLQPKTPAGIAAVARALKRDQDYFWQEPEPDRDWGISLLTRFIDGLADLGQTPAGADRPAAQLIEEARA